MVFRKGLCDPFLSSDLLTPFLFKPFEEKYAKQIEDETRELLNGESPSHERVLAFLKMLVESEVLKAVPKGKRQYYKLNTVSEVALSRMVMLELHRRHWLFNEDKSFLIFLAELAEEARKLFDKKGLQMLLLFGSGARGQLRRDSDVDLLFIVSKPSLKNKLKEFVEHRSAISGRKISAHVMPVKDLKAVWHKEPFYKSVWDDRVILLGAYEFWKFVFEEGKP